MGIFETVCGVALVLFVLSDAFESIVLPRRITRRFRMARLFYRTSWHVWSAIARRMAAGKRREAYLSFYGPLSLLMLLGFWAASIVVGFAMLLHGIGSPVGGQGLGRGFVWDLYFSGSTFFTLGLGDLTPQS